MVLETTANQALFSAPVSSAFRAKLAFRLYQPSAIRKQVSTVHSSEGK